MVEKMLKTIRHRKSGSQRHDIGPKHEIQIFLEDFVGLGDYSKSQILSELFSC
jgi:hypothetical protein